MELLPKTGGYGELGGVAEKIAGDAVIDAYSKYIQLGPGTSATISLPFVVANPAELTIDLFNTAPPSSNDSSFIGFVPAPDGSGYGSATGPITFTYQKSSNSVFVSNNSGSATASMVIHARKNRRRVKNFGYLPAGVLNTDVTLPFAISDPKKCYLGVTNAANGASDTASNPSFVNAFLTDAGACHLAFRYNGSIYQVCVTSSTTFKSTNTAISAGAVYAIEFA